MCRFWRQSILYGVYGFLWLALVQKSIISLKCGWYSRYVLYCLLGNVLYELTKRDDSIYYRINIGTEICCSPRTLENGFVTLAFKLPLFVGEALFLLKSANKYMFRPFSLFSKFVDLVLLKYTYLQLIFKI